MPRLSEPMVAAIDSKASSIEEVDCCSTKAADSPSSHIYESFSASSK